MLIIFFKKHTIFIALVIVLQFLPVLSVNASQETDCFVSYTDNLPEKSVLERCKYAEEIRKLQLENNRTSGTLGSVITFAPSFGILGFLAAIIVAFISYYSNKKQRNAEDFRDKERRTDEKFNAILEQLGHNSLSMQASAASSLLTFIEPSYDRFWKDILVIVPANLKKSVSLKPAIQESLTRVLEKIVSLELCKKTKFDKLNLSRTVLFRLDFRGFDFNGVEVDIAFAKMRYANLKGAKLPRLKGIGVCLNNAKMSKCNLHEARLNKSHCKNAQFHESILTSVTFKEADLREAQFHKAHLQSAHFEGADLRGANFTGANLDNAYFIGAKFDNFAMCSILNGYKTKTPDKNNKTKTWERAHFDKSTSEELKRLDNERSRGNKNDLEESCYIDSDGE